MLVGCYGWKIHPVCAHSKNHLEKVSLCHLPCRKTDLMAEMPLSFLMKDCTFGCSFEKKKQKQLLKWQLNQQFIGSFFISSIRETPLTLYQRWLYSHQGKERSEHQGYGVVFANRKMADWTDFLSPHVFYCFFIDLHFFLTFSASCLSLIVT